MNQFYLISKIYDIIGKYKDQNVKSFYASSIVDDFVDDLKYNKIDYNNLEKDVVLALDFLVNNGMLKRKYVIFNPENPSEKKVYKDFSQIPIGTDIEFDFNDVYIDSASSPLIKTFFVFPKDRKNFIPKEKAPVLLKTRTKGAPMRDSESREINIYIKQVQIIEAERNTMGDNISQNFNNNTINQAAAKISNENNTVNLGTEKISKRNWEKIYSLIESDIVDLKTGNDQADEEIAKLKSINNDNSSLEKKSKITEHVNNLYTICKIGKIALPALTSLFKMFGLSI